MDLDRILKEFVIKNPVTVTKSRKSVLELSRLSTVYGRWDRFERDFLIGALLGSPMPPLVYYNDKLLSGGPVLKTLTTAIVESTGSNQVKQLLEQMELDVYRIDPEITIEQAQLILALTLPSRGF